MLFIIISVTMALVNLVSARLNYPLVGHDIIPMGSGSEFRAACNLPPVPLSEYQNKYKDSTKRLILLDHDGVLVDSSDSIYQWKPQIRKTLEGLLQDKKNEVWIISARSLDALQQIYSSIRDLNLAGDHGTQIHVDGRTLPDFPPLTDITRLKNQVELMAKEYGLPESHMKFKNYVITLFYKRDHKELNHLTYQRMCRYLKSIPQQQPGFEDYVFQGGIGQSMAILKHKDYHKGTLASVLLSEQSFDFGLSMGDQPMDEPMHQAMSRYNFFSVIVTSTYSQPTMAKHRVEGSYEARELLNSLQFCDSDCCSIT